MSKLLKPGTYFLEGNIACAEAALLAGCRFYAGYPITPSSELMHHMARRMPEVGGVFIQGEDEIASIMMALGGSAAGLKSMTATSGPGLSLMQESIGLAAMLELPVVIVDIQRAGPSTGIPTLMGQGDIMQAKWGSHGDYEVVAYLPSTPQELFDITIEAFNTAEEYRVPVIVLADKIIGQMYGRIKVPDHSEIKLIERKKPAIPPEKYMEYLPYDSKELIPPFAAAGDGYRIHMTGLMHDDRGYPNLSQEASWKLVTRLVRKIRENARKIAKWGEHWIDDAEYLIVAYGSVSGPVRYAIKKAREEGYKVGLFRPLTAWPFPGWRIKELDNSGVIKKFIVIEVNMGQIYHVVREYVRNAEVIHVPGAPGYLPEPQRILSYIKKFCR